MNLGPGAEDGRDRREHGPDAQADRFTDRQHRENGQQQRAEDRDRHDDVDAVDPVDRCGRLGDRDGEQEDYDRGPESSRPHPLPSAIQQRRRRCVAVERGLGTG